MAECIAKVWNDHDKDHVEMFKGDEIRVPAKGFIKMEWSEAVQFRGQYTPIERDGMGNDLKPKKIRLEKMPVELSGNEAQQFICQMDRQEFSSQEELDEHIKLNHMEQMVDDDAKTKLRTKAK